MLGDIHAPCLKHVLLWGSQSDGKKGKKKKKESADKRIITIFGGFAIVHLTCRTLKLYNKSWFF